MANLKVTFYNDVSIVENINDYKKANTESGAGFTTGGIYFTSPDAIQDGDPAHIIHGNNGFIYTLGSYVLSNSKNYTYNLTYVTGNEFKMDTETYIISDIISDPFEKTLTVTKSKITLGEEFVKTINELQSFKNTVFTNQGKKNKITVGGKYNVWFEISDIGVFTLKTETLGEGEFTYYFWDNNDIIHNDITEAFQIATINSGYFCITAPTEIENVVLTIPQSFKDGDISYELSDSNTTAKFIIPNGGWDETDKTSLTFSAEIKTKGNNIIASSETTFNFKLERIESPFKFSETTNSYAVFSNKASKISLGNSDFLTRNFDDVTSLDITYTPKEYLSFYKAEDIFDSYFEVRNSYYLPSNNEKITFNYSDNTIETNTYYAYLRNTAKQANIKLSGASQWALQLQPDPDDANTYYAYSYFYNTVKNPLTLCTPSKDGKTFEYWADENGNKVASVKFGNSLFDTTTHTCRLKGHWTDNTQYYWYAGWTEPTEANIATIVNEKYPIAKGSTIMNPAGKTSTTLAGTVIDFGTNPIYDQEARNVGTPREFYFVIPTGYGIYNPNMKMYLQDGPSFEKVGEFTNHIILKNTEGAAYKIGDGWIICELTKYN